MSVVDEWTHLDCEVCGTSTAIDEAVATLTDDGTGIVHTCPGSECLAKAKTLTYQRCDFRPRHNTATDRPEGPLCNAPATHAFLWLDGTRRYSLGCSAHLVLETATPHVLVPLDKETPCPRP